MRWILDDVDELVSTGVLTPETGTALRSHYEQKLAQEDSGGKTVLLAVLGATLIGAGLILIIAHNWDDLGRPVRTVLSLLPLLVGIALAFWALLKRADSTAWREGAGVAQCAGVAASIALVSQTYHISGELSDFLFTWMLLTLPIPYLLRAVVPALIYLAGIAVWAGTSFNLLYGRNHGAPAYWLFLVAILPFYGFAVRENRLGKSTAWLSAILGLSIIFGLIFSNMQGIWIPAFSGLFGVLYLIGALMFPESRYHPLRVLGALGVAILSIWLSFKYPWSFFSISWPENLWPVYALAVGFSSASLGLLAWAFFRKADINWFAAIFPLIALIAYIVAAPQHRSEGERTFVALILNIYALTLALGTAFRGIQQRAFATLNGGLLILAALIISRFVDSDFSIVARGIAFVVMGCVMLGANFWLLKAKREVNA